MISNIGIETSGIFQSQNLTKKECLSTDQMDIVTRGTASRTVLIGGLLIKCVGRSEKLSTEEDEKMKRRGPKNRTMDVVGLKSYIIQKKYLR